MKIIYRQQSEDKKSKENHSNSHLPLDIVIQWFMRCNTEGPCWYGWPSFQWLFLILLTWLIRLNRLTAPWLDYFPFYVQGGKDGHAISQRSLAPNRLIIKIMATRRSSRILTTTIEVCPDSDADEPENRSSNKVEQSKTPSGKQSDRCSSRLKVLQEVSKTAPRKQRRVMGTEREGPKRLVPADLWTKAMKKDVSL